ncbi:hypothetical protein EDC01DRAFT_634126 [Geopyxis carbonaria]|nr:hypothetical protein EDC01DRAFT_634126 [Geopyxis carbonaria]
MTITDQEQESVGGIILQQEGSSHENPYLPGNPVSSSTTAQPGNDCEIDHTLDIEVSCVASQIIPNQSIEVHEDPQNVNQAEDRAAVLSDGPDDATVAGERPTRGKSIDLLRSVLASQKKRGSVRNRGSNNRGQRKRSKRSVKPAKASTNVNDLFEDAAKRDDTEEEMFFKFAPRPNLYAAPSCIQLQPCGHIFHTATWKASSTMWRGHTCPVRNCGLDVQHNIRLGNGDDVRINQNRCFAARCHIEDMAIALAKNPDSWTVPCSFADKVEILEDSRMQHETHEDTSLVVVRDHAARAIAEMEKAIERQRISCLVDTSVEVIKPKVVAEVSKRITRSQKA